MSLRKTAGFSLLEMMITVSVSLTLTAVAVFTLQPSLQQQHVNDAYNLTMMTLRRAHDQAQADMRQYQVQFLPAVAGTNGGTMTVTQLIAGSPQLLSVTLPSDVTFHVEPGVPTSNTTAPTTPDAFGNAAYSFDFTTSPTAMGGSTIVFYPDGTAHDTNGDILNGVVYMGKVGFLSSCRAMTLWGYTGRIRGWRLYQNGGSWSWSQQ